MTKRALLVGCNYPGAIIFIQCDMVHSRHIPCQHLTEPV
jgi:hypothetical protein